MKASSRRKLIMSIGASVMTACCLTSTTYAWFAKNANAWVDEFNLDIRTYDGLEISVDGETYYDSIDKETLFKAIALSRYNISNTEKKTISELTSEEITTYTKTTIIPVSPDKNMNFWGFDTQNVTDLYSEYAKGGYYKPVNLTEAGITYGYVSFDLYFRVLTTSMNPKDSYKLIFADKNLPSNPESTNPNPEYMTESYIKATASTIKLSNELSIPVFKDLREDAEITKGLYKSGQSISVNPADASRIGVVNKDESLKVIYEMNEGYGSSAYKDIPDDAFATDNEKAMHDPDQNAMITYFNNVHKRAKLEVKSYSDWYQPTQKDFTSHEKLGTFTKNADGEYNIVKATFYLWLDGYDADYLDEVDTKSMHFYLNFTKVEA